MIRPLLFLLFFTKCSYCFVIFSQFPEPTNIKQSSYMSDQSIENENKDLKRHCDLNNTKPGKTLQENSNVENNKVLQENENLNKSHINERSFIYINQRYIRPNTPLLASREKIIPPIINLISPSKSLIATIDAKRFEEFPRRFDTGKFYDENLSKTSNSNDKKASIEKHNAPVRNINDDYSKRIEFINKIGLNKINVNNAPNQQHRDHLELFGHPRYADATNTQSKVKDIVNMYYNLTQDNNSRYLKINKAPFTIMDVISNAYKNKDYKYGFANHLTKVADVEAHVEDSRDDILLDDNFNNVVIDTDDFKTLDRFIKNALYGNDSDIDSSEKDKAKNKKCKKHHKHHNEKCSCSNKNLQ